MTNKPENPYNALEKIFHEPNRLAIMSALCRSTDGMTFNELKEECELTDGNLSRHLKALEEAKAVKIKKAFVKAKPQTTVLLSENGRENFIQYLKALEEVLQAAAQATATDRKKSPGSLWGSKTSTA
jgi:DNA-binding transcriptional ArsR family regulator